MKIASTFLLGAVCASALASPAMAFTPSVAWSMTANACTATSKSINDERYATSSFVTHRGTNVDPITLICPIQPTASLVAGNWEMDITYLDSTGVGAGAKVEVKLMEQKLSDGVTTAISTFNSNTDASLIVHKSTKAFTHGFDFTLSAYFVQIKLDRTNTGQAVRAYNVAVWSAP